MIYNRNYLIAATDITGRNKPFARFRGKTAKEIYRCGKGIICTRSVIGPMIHAGGELAIEVSKGFVAGAAGSAIEAGIGYISGFGFIRWIYKATDVGYIKTIARIGYNVVGLPFTIYSKGIGTVTDFLQIGILEEKWFGERVYIFDDNRLWIEKNFSIADAFKF